MLGTEEKTLFDFIGGEILHREMLHDAFNSIPPGSDKVSQIQEMQQLSNRKVASSVKQTWKKALESSLPLIPAFLSVSSSDSILSEEEIIKIRSLDHDAQTVRLQELFGLPLYKKFSETMQVEAQIHSKLCTALSSIVDPVIFDAATTVCVPILQSIIEIVSQVYMEAVSGFREEIQLLVKSGELTPRSLSRSSAGSGGTHTALRVSDDSSTIQLQEVLAGAHMRVNSGYNSGPLQSARQLLWTMYTVNLNQPDVLHCFVGKGLSAYDVYIQISDSVTELVHNAIYTIGEMLLKAQDAAEEIDLETANSAAVISPTLETCVEMMSEDAKIYQEKALVDIFKR